MIENNIAGPEELRTTRESLYKALIGMFETAEKKHSLNVALLNYLPLAFDTSQPLTEEIPKIAHLISVAGENEKILFPLIVFPDVEKRSTGATGEEIESIYDGYLKVVDELKDPSLKMDNKTYFTLMRLSNAINKLGDKSLADSSIKELESLAPLSDETRPCFPTYRKPIYKSSPVVNSNPCRLAILPKLPAKDCPRKREDHRRRSISWLIGNL